MRFVHTADWQLGMTRYFLNGEAQPRYSAARRDVEGRVLERRGDGQGNRGFRGHAGQGFPLD